MLLITTHSQLNLQQNSIKVIPVRLKKRMFALRMFRPKCTLTNLQMILDDSRVLQHKRYQMKNQIQFSQLNHQLPTRFLQKNQIETRILKLLHESNLVDTVDFSFCEDIRKEYYLDSLDITALVSSIQEEFNTIFDADTYENARTLEVIVEALENDNTIV